MYLIVTKVFPPIAIVSLFSFAFGIIVRLFQIWMIRRSRNGRRYSIATLQVALLESHFDLCKVCAITDLLLFRRLDDPALYPIIFSS